MTTPYPYPSRLQERAKARGINLQRAKRPVLADLYRETLIGIYNEIYKQELDELARNENFVKLLARDLREIVNGLHSLARAGYRDIIEVSGTLETARQELAVAVILFDTVEVVQPIARIRGRVRALSKFGQILHKVVLSWPKVSN